MINTENPISRDMILRSTYKLKEYNQVVYTNLELKSADKKKQKECLKTRGELIDEKNKNLNKKDIRFRIFLCRNQWKQKLGLVRRKLPRKTK